LKIKDLRPGDTIFFSRYNKAIPIAKITVRRRKTLFDVALFRLEFDKFQNVQPFFIETEGDRVILNFNGEYML
jgi:hypothetical protein